MKIIKITILFALLGLLSTQVAESQVTIGADKRPNESAILEFVQNVADNTSNKGLLLPRVRLTDIAASAPMSKMDTAMMVYNKTQGGTVDKDVYINNGFGWRGLSLDNAPSAGQYLVLGSNLKPTWRTIPVPQPVDGVYTLMSSRSYNLYEMRTFQENNSPWLHFGDTIHVRPTHTINRMVMTVQVLMNKEYDPANPVGWVEYEGGVFVDDFDNPQDSRTGKLVYQNFNTERTYVPVTLHFVVENLTAGNKDVVIKFRRKGSENFNGILYIGYDERVPPTAPTGNVNLFNTSSSISMQFYEEKASVPL